MSQAVAWALFDLANTFFAVAMLSFYFPMWVIEEQGATELVFSLAVGGSMALVAALMPLCGALSDATGRRMSWLRWTTYGCVGATLAIGWTHDLRWALLLFGMANVCYQLGTVFYDALLWRVAAPERLGRVSGLGAAYGYLGSMLGLALLWPFVRSGGPRAAIVPSALFFLLFALPSFLLIHERAAGPGIRWGEVVRTAHHRLMASLRAARAVDGLWRYLWAGFFSAMAINTILVFMAVYTRKVLGFEQDQVVRFFLFGQFFAVLGALAFRGAVRRIGAKQALMVIWCGWIVALGLVAFGASGRWLWIAGPLVGFCLGPTWATSRVLVMELAPKARLAEMLGLAGLAGRAASILGPLLWGLVVQDPSRYGHAIVMLMGLLAIGIWLLSGVQDAKRVAAAL